MSRKIFSKMLKISRFSDGKTPVSYTPLLEVAVDGKEGLEVVRAGGAVVHTVQPLGHFSDRHCVEVSQPTVSIIRRENIIIIIFKLSL